MAGKLWAGDMYRNNTLAAMWEGTWTHERGEDLAKYMRKIAPNVIVNNRIDKGRAGMDGETHCRLACAATYRIR